MSSSRSVKGSLSQTPVTQIMAYIYRKSLSGTLIIRDTAGGEFKVVFIDGMPSYVEGKGLGHPVGEIIVETGLLSKEKLEECIKEAKEKKLLLGQYLLTLGCIEKRQLDTAVRIQIRRRIIDLFKIFEGEYEFYRDENISEMAGDSMLKTDLSAILPEAVRESWSDEMLAGAVDKLSGHMFKVVEIEECRKSFGWNVEEMNALILLGEKIWTIEKVRGIGGFSPRAMNVVLYVLLLTGKLDFEIAKIMEEEERRKNEERKKRIETMLVMMQKKMEQIENGNYFEILEVSMDAGSEEIKDAFVRILQQFHPDRVRSLGVAELEKGFEKISQKVKEAMDILVNPDSRQKYLEHLKGTGKDSKEEEQIVRQVLTDEISFQKALVMLNKKNYREVVKFLEPVIEKGTDNGEYIAVYAWAKVCLAAQGEPIGLYVQMLKDAVEKSPQSERAHFFLALASKRDGKLQDYREHIKATVEINPHNMEAQRHLNIIKLQEEKQKKSSIFSKLDGGTLGGKIKDLLKKKI